MRQCYRVLALLALTFSLLGAMPRVAQAESCTFILGFATLHAMIPDVTGACINNEGHLTNGDGSQNTVNGILFWRKADNFTAFSDGSQTWINGPLGLQSRLGSERFAWEVSQAKVASTQEITFVPPKTASRQVAGQCPAWSIAATRPDALHCTTDSDAETFETCFVAQGNSAAVICVPDPTDPMSFVQLNLAQPLPPSRATPDQAQPWFLKLADGSTCTYFINAHNDVTGNVDGRLINYHCSSGWDLLDEPQRGTTWTISAIFRDPDFTVRQSVTAEIAVAWE